jgi:hypothetical protein
VAQVRQRIDSTEVDYEFMTDTFYCFQANIIGVRNHWPAPEDVVAELQACAPPSTPRTTMMWGNRSGC